MSLAAHLARQQQRLEALVTLLEQEREALCAGRVDGQQLNELAAGKQALFDELDRLESQRRSAQHKLGYAEGLPGAEAAARDADCLHAWLAMRDSAERARHLNAQNGELITTRLNHNQRTLNFLHEAAGKALYGPDGQAKRKGLAGIASKA
ncbi:flagellar protein FlgN [Halomonas sp. 1513]|nr:flagellar protein FlgN [Halomonas sp. 1513]APX93291.1 flagellar protein FlgN [Halomonas sp. 1513]